MRLNKYIAHSGVTSRRKADELIALGKVTVNGIMPAVGYEVQDGDVIEVDGQVIRPEKKLVYYMLHKPPGYLTTTEDDRGRRTVMELLDEPGERVYPVGRLDYQTAGLLLLTNDGELANHLMHPSKKIEKTYVAEVSGFFRYSDAKKLRNGVDIGDQRRTAPADVEILKQSDTVSTVIIRIHEGRNRQVRRMMEAVGHHVIRLERTAIGNLKLGHLKMGRFRKLSENEIRYLKKL